MAQGDKLSRREDKELSKFLDKVNEVECIMKGMTCGEEDAEVESVKKADELIAKYEKKEKDKQDEDDSIARTGVNRTVINKNAYKNDDVTKRDGVTSVTDQSGFMSALEDDARERHERRQKMTKEANDLKVKGNAFFKNGDLEKAIDLYTEGLTKIKDLLPLWTNRAMAFNKLGRYEEALNDCDWAFRIQENCPKAFLQQGKAYLGLEEFDKAREAYKKIVECDPSLQKQVEDYIHDVDLVEQSKRDAQTAKKLFDDENADALSLSDLIEKVKTPRPRLEYYLGGLQFLQNALRNDQDRLLFKTSDGFKLHKFDMIEKSFQRITTSKAKKTDLDLCVVIYHLYEHACAGLEISQRLLFDDVTFKEQTLAILECRKLDSVQIAVLQFLKSLSNDGFGLKLILTLDTERFAKCLLQHCINEKRATLALNLLVVLTKESKFNARTRSMLNDVIIPFYVTLESSNSERQMLIMTSFVNMTSDASLRRGLNDSQYLWKISSKLLRKFENDDVMNLLLAFLINLTVEKSENVAKLAREISQVSLSKIAKPEFQKGIIGLISHILPKYPDSKEVISRQFVELCVQLCSNELDSDLSKYSARCLACVSKDPTLSSAILENDGLKILVTLVSGSVDDVIANALISITDLLEFSEKKTSVAIFEENDFVKTLLVLVRDTRNETVKKNAAILLAKMAKLDAVFLERLRELKGIEILMQNIRAEDL